MPPAENRPKQGSGDTPDPVHQHGPDDISRVSEHGELNPGEHHPSNAETQGVWKVLRFSTIAAIVAMVVVGIIAFSAFG